MTSLVEMLQSYRYPTTPEKALQDALQSVLGPGWSREYRLGPADVVDFYRAGTGIEVKIGGSVTDVTRQLFRYAIHPSINSLLLVTTRMQHRAIAREMNGKPVGVLYIGAI